MSSFIQVLTIHDTRDDSVLAFDLKDILRLLKSYLDRWTWCVLDLDCFGGSSDVACKAVGEAKGSGIWVSSAELVHLAEEIDQTIEGKFLAFPLEIDRQTVDINREWWNFPEGKAVLAIHAVDSSFFEIYAKDPEIARLLRGHFRDVRLEDPVLYFGDS